MGWMIPVALGVSTLASSLIGGKSGGTEPTAPAWLIDMLKGEAAGGVSGAFLPDKSAYDENLQAQLAQLMSQMGVNVEQFNVGAASRGVFGAGEGMTSLYRDVVNPIFQTAASTTAGSNLAYTQAFQRGSMQAEGFRQNALQMLVQATLGRAPGGQGPWDRFGGGMQNLGEMGFQLSLLKELGLLT